MMIMKKLTTILLIATLAISKISAQTNHRDSIDIKHYNLQLDFTAMVFDSIKGKAIIIFNPKFNNTYKFGFDLQKLVVKSLKINNQVLDYSHHNNIVRFTTPQRYNIADTLTLEIDYLGKPAKDPTGWGGFYFTQGLAFNLGVGMSVDPHPYGRCWYPCNDSFTDKATYNYNITTHATQKAVCGGEFLSDTIDENGNKVWQWKTQQPIPTYLTSVVVGSLEKIEFTYNGIDNQIPVEIYCKQSQLPTATTAFADVTQMLGIFEQAFGPYPFPKVGYTVVDFQNGAMEHVMNIATPNNVLNMQLSSQTLLAHELSHSWFGNNVTCATAMDMWLNEGWAVFCEGLYVEKRYGLEEGKKYVLEHHKNALLNAHIADGAFLPLYGIDHNNTYGRTIYIKGGDFVRSLRKYLGDSIFFQAIKQWFEQNQFTSKTTHQFRDFLSSATNINLTPFFDTWIFNPGFPHYSISNLIINNTQATVEITQNRLGSRYIGNANKVEVTFFKTPTDTVIRTVTFDGKRGSATFNLPFKPNFAIVDYNADIADATIKTKQMVRKKNTIFSGQYLTVYPQTTTDSAWIHVTYNHVKPDNYGQIFDGIELTPHYYWTININPYGNFRARAKFYHTTIQNPADTTWKPQTTDKLEMLYRASPAQRWRKLEIQNNLTWSDGTATVDSLRAGEYAFGIFRQGSNVQNQNSNNKNIIIPNPITDKAKFILQSNRCEKIEIYDIDGKMIEHILTDNLDTVELDFSNYKQGTYIARFVYRHDEVESRKFIVTK